MSELQNKLPRGSYAIAHIESSGYSLIAGNFHYSRFRIVQITKATRDGEAKEFSDYPGSCSKRVDRKTTIYGFPVKYADKAEKAFAAQALDFTGYYDKGELKAALEAI